MGTTEVKSRAERLKETIHLVKQIRDLGIHETEPSYLEVKEKLNNWIKSEEKHVHEYVFDFVRYGRKATLTLPWRADKPCEFRMKSY
jgi:hypothetical protein